MEIKSIKSILVENQFTLSDLGDGTSVLTSLTDSKIISVNKLGTRILSSIIDSKELNENSVVDQLVEDISTDFGVSKKKAKEDVANFLSDFKSSLVVKS